MKQFPSVKKRRKHQKGNGLRQRFPEPASYLLSCGDAPFILEPPNTDPYWQAAMMVRWLTWTDKYAAIDARYGGPLRWRVAPLPVRYAVGPVDDVFGRLVSQYLDGLTSPPVDLGGESSGAGGYSPTPPFELQTYATVVPGYGVDDMLTQLWSADDTTTGWFDGSGGSLKSVVWESPVQTITQYYPTHPPIVTIKPIVRYELNAAGDGYLDGVEIWQRAIELILWGHASCPDKLADNAVGNALQRPAGFAAKQWLDWIEVNAGRVLWQMAHVETLLEITDICNVATGGRGGPVHPGGKFLAGNPTPPSNPPLPPSTWSRVAPYVDKAISGAIQAAVEAAIVAL